MLESSTSPNQSLEDPAQNDFVSEFSYLYKNTGKDAELSQQTRRDLLLQEQKEHRHNLVDQHRDFSDLFLEDASEEMSEITEPSEDMDVDVEQKRRKKEKRFALMRSEWLTEVPVDLEDNWLVKLAPEGFRVLLIAKKNSTVLVNEKGRVLKLKTHLSGGGLSGGHGLTVLDCIYDKTSKTIFVLDCLFWNTMSMLNSETAFRFYWLKNQFEDNTRLTDTNKAHKLHILEFFPAERSLIQEKLFENSGNIQYNGIAFYHKELQYIFDQTPLLCWLYAYMLPEKLGIDIPQVLMNKMPKDYECLEKYIKILEEKQQKARQRKNRHERKEMDTS